jgi:hypothetical protein
MLTRSQPTLLVQRSLGSLLLQRGPGIVPDGQRARCGRLQRPRSAEDITTRPFFSMERFEQRLEGHTAAPGWGCVIGEVAGEIVGYAYGFTLRTGRHWIGLQTEVDPDLVREDGRRTFILCEIMVCARWRGTQIAHGIHQELITHRPEERATLLVEQQHPRVRARYEQWGYRKIGELLPFPDAPRYDALLLQLR